VNDVLTFENYALGKVTAEAVVPGGGKSWFFLTADYAFGHSLEENTTSHWGTRWRDSS
jgi:branched-chain amino acid transport system substrate-binding protein